MAEGLRTSGRGQTSPRELALWTFAIFGFAALVRYVVLQQVLDALVFDIPLGDARGHQLWARELANQAMQFGGAFPYAPLYPYFVGAVYYIAGESLEILRNAQIVLGATSCVLIAQVAWRYFSKSTGILAGLILALHPAAVFAAITLETTVLEIFLVCAALAYVGDLDARAGKGAALGLGLAMGALILTRESTWVFAAVLLAWLSTLPMRERAIRLACAGIFVAGIVAVLLPVMIRNHAVTGSADLSQSQVAYEMFVGNNPESDGTEATAMSPDVWAVVIAHGLGHAPDRSEISGFYRERMSDFIRNDPGAALRLMIRKLMLALNTVELADTQDHVIYADHSSVLDLTVPPLRVGILFPLAFLAVFVRRSMRRRLWPWFGIVGAHLLMAAATYATGRDRLVILPIVVLLAASALTGLRSFLGSRPAGPMVAGLAATAIIALIANWPIVEPRIVQSMTFQKLGDGLAGVGLTNRAILRYERAIELDPDNAVAQHNLGMLRARRKDFGVAEIHLREALRAAPWYADAHFGLGRVLEDSYDPLGAIESYRKGLEFDPNRTQAHADLARLLRKHGDPAEAEEHQKRAEGLAAPSE